ncbi:hypothetical protein [Lacipirellula sp.]|uniref:hypothetical protein n=1 Tax=Lacipirellula sp. TaxID=2691419 RepID=UPI003D12249F
MSLSAEELAILQAVERCTSAGSTVFSKCAAVLRAIVESDGAWSEAQEDAVCNSGYEEEKIGRLYDALRDLVARGYLASRGDLASPAGPRYTECGLTDAGRSTIS